MSVNDVQPVEYLTDNFFFFFKAKIQIDEESEASLLSAFSEMLDSAIEDTLSPFDTLPDSKLFLGQRCQDSRVRLFHFIQSFSANMLNKLCNVMSAGVPLTVECLSVIDFFKLNLHCFCVSITGEVALSGQRSSSSGHQVPHSLKFKSKNVHLHVLLLHGSVRLYIYFKVKISWKQQQKEKI